MFFPDRHTTRTASFSFAGSFSGNDTITCRSSAVATQVSVFLGVRPRWRVEADLDDPGAERVDAGRSRLVRVRRVRTTACRRRRRRVEGDAVLVDRLVLGERGRQVGALMTTMSASATAGFGRPTSRKGSCAIRVSAQSVERGEREKPTFVERVHPLGDRRVGVGQ